MAQEARLNLRMQRELKLLLTDPPHGASFPSLTSSSSLSSIHAQIEGPEGTVYANGFFKLKIQIPERYPFQPPIVTFVTPIYHPNIDNGGRICLDILNLPPKGAWQPSLNISTVITSIGLLLSEPNPDDGLMHDASTEYKYNRQAFDQKARSMTQKYARAEAGDFGCHDQEIQNVTDSREGLVEAKESNLQNAEVPDHFVNQKRSFGLSRKLSLDSAGHGQRYSGGTTNEVPLNHACNKKIEVGGVKPVMKESTECSLSQDKVQQSAKKLSSELASPSEVRNGAKKEDMVQTQFSTWLEPECNRKAFNQKARSMTQKYARAETSDFGCHDQEIQNTRDTRGLVEAKESNLPNAEVPDNFANQKRLFGLSRKLSLDSAGHTQRHSGETGNEVPLNHAFNKQIEVGGIKPVTKESTECSLNQDKVQQSAKKLFSELVSQPEVKNGGKKEDMVQTQWSTSLESQSVLLSNADIRPLPQAGKNSTANPNNSDMRNFSTNKSAKKRLLKPTDFGQKNEDLEKLRIKPQFSPQLQFAASCQTLSLSKTPGHYSNNPHNSAADQNKIGFSTRHKKLGLTGRKHSFGTSSSSQTQQKDNKENLAPSQDLPLSKSDTCADSTCSLSFHSEIGETCDAWTKKSSNLCETPTKQPLLAAEQFGENKYNSVQSNSQSGRPSVLQVNHRLPCEDLCNDRQHKLLSKEEDVGYNRNIKHQEKGSPKCEAVVVLDSEDSEDERSLPKRSKLSLARRRFPGKRKA